MNNRQVQIAGLSKKETDILINIAYANLVFEASKRSFDIDKSILKQIATEMTIHPNDIIKELSGSVFERNKRKIELLIEKLGTEAIDRWVRKLLATLFVWSATPDSDMWYRLFDSVAESDLRADEALKIGKLEFIRDMIKQKSDKLPYTPISKDDIDFIANRICNGEIPTEFDTYVDNDGNTQVFLIDAVSILRDMPLSSIIFNYVNWKNSPKGHDYWCGVYETAIDEEAGANLKKASPYAPYSSSAIKTRIIQLNSANPAYARLNKGAIDTLAVAVGDTFQKHETMICSSENFLDYIMSETSDICGVISNCIAYGTLEREWREVLLAIENADESFVTLIGRFDGADDILSDFIVVNKPNSNSNLYDRLNCNIQIELSRAFGDDVFSAADADFLTPFWFIDAVESAVLSSPNREEALKCAKIEIARYIHNNKGNINRHNIMRPIRIIEAGYETPVSNSLKYASEIRHVIDSIVARYVNDYGIIPHQNVHLLTNEIREFLQFVSGFNSNGLSEWIARALFSPSVYDNGIMKAKRMLSEIVLF